MKNFKKYLFLLYLIVTILLSGCNKQPSNNNQNANNNPTECQKHSDNDNNGVCDTCYKSVFVYFDFYAINDLHGKLSDGEDHPGVDELSTYLKRKQLSDDHVVLLSSGDMWQGSAESNMTKGLIITDWMNEMGFVSMTLGNHEFDWGESYIEENAKLAEFPFLAINIYDRETDQRVDYCQASVMLE